MYNSKRPVSLVAAQFINKGQTSLISGVVGAENQLTEAIKYWSLIKKDELEVSGLANIAALHTLMQQRSTDIPT